MKDMSFIEKLQVLADVSSSSGICIASIFIIVFIASMLLTVNKNNNKKVKFTLIVAYIAVVLILLITYSSSLSSMFDYMMNNFFILVYFPNLAIYLAAIIASNIIIWNTVFTNKKNKILKVVNVLMYSIMHYLLILILNIVSENKLNVFDNSSVYANNDALALIGLSSTIFLVWIIFIIIYSIVRKTGPKEEVEYNKVKTVYKKLLPSNILEVAKPKVVREVPKYVLPKNIIDTVVPMVVKEDIKHRLPSNTGIIKAPRVVKDYGIKQIVAPKLANMINIENTIVPDKKRVKLIDFETADLELAQKYDSMLSLDDYKTVLDILKNKDKYETKINAINTNDTILEKPVYNNYTNDIISDVKDTVIQPKLDELLNLSNA